MGKRKIQLAILDMYDGEPNQGMRCIHDILSRFSERISWKEFDVRGKSEIPDITEFDLFISTGGPGNPLEGNGDWDLKYSDFLDQVLIWNQNHSQKKHLMLICHSFQMACEHFGLGKLTTRKSTSSGTAPLRMSSVRTRLPA